MKATFQKLPKMRETELEVVTTVTTAVREFFSWCHKFSDNNLICCALYE